MRTKRTEFIGDSFRQHRIYTVRKIYRSSTIIGFLVQRGTGFYIMTHIGNMYTDFIDIIFQWSERNSVIKILGICRINGEC